MFFEFLQKNFRCCLHCGSFQCGPSQFCAACEGDLWRFHNQLQKFELRSSKVYGWALLDWYPDQDRKVSKLLMTLKGGDLKEAFQFYADSFIGRMGKRKFHSTVLVPCPSNGSRKHAERLAAAFSKRLEIPLSDSLRKPVSIEQKAKGIAERALIEMTNERDYSRQHVIFIDDIVTTGATALSARNAIGSCLSFEVWCLAHRR